MLILRPMKAFGKLVFAIVILLAGFTVFLLAPAHSSTPDSTAQASTVPPSTPDKPVWKYETISMDAGSKAEKMGCIQSDETLQFKFPYHENRADLCFRSNGDVFLTIQDGQIPTGDGYFARVRIGATPVRSFRLDEPTDESSTVAFLAPAAPLFAAARSGSKITVEATYYNAGNQTITFSPDAPMSIAPPSNRASRKRKPAKLFTVFNDAP